MKPAYLWLDTETTGLDVPRVALLEVGAAIVDYRFEVISTFERVVHFDRRYKHPDLKYIEPHVIEMHEHSGLWHDCEVSKLEVEDVERQLMVWAKAFDCGDIPLGGRSIWFDRRVCEVHMPEFAKCLNHRQFDTRALDGIARSLGVVDFGHTGEHPHRALRDVLGDLADVRAFVARFGPDYIP